jgi:hypothetical protein
MINEDDIEALAPGFKEWLEGSEGPNTRYQRLCATFAHLDAHDHRALLSWLQLAYSMGYFQVVFEKKGNSNDQ